MKNLSLIKQRNELLPLLMNGQVNFDLKFNKKTNCIDFF